MKKFILGFFALVAFSFVNAQTTSDYVELVRTQLKAEKKVVVMEVLQLSDAEATVFWPLYDEYNGKMYTVQTKRVQLIKDFAKNYENMTPEVADDLVKRMFAIKGELLKLDQTYYKKFKKVLPLTKVASYFQLENKIETLVNAELAVEIPLLQGN
ncbi:MAG: hypothetical protein IH598_00205 [Bacteroidales bacterium]|nr:hypothetical protein [Bacteroidales bacterium]